ncbi:MAG: NOP58 family protein [Candidatus Micrarchaeota archaeon]|nr:NOP58 family protein [Candidatus Micrarchaeota archaeon]
MIKAAKGDIKAAYGNEEYILIQAINAFNESSRSYNLMYERLSEWFGIYFPEVKVASPAVLAELAISMCNGEELDRKTIEKIVDDPEKAESIFEKAKETMGRKPEGDEKDAVAAFAGLAKDMGKGIQGLDEYIKSAAKRIMPNVTHLTEDKIAAELLAKAGSLERMATMPASTIQLLGAEKALFKHIKFGSKPPKYGIIFKLPAVTAAQREKKGMVARAYATKIAIAVKADYFTKKFIADKLKESLDGSIEKITAKEVAPKSYQQFNDRRRGSGPQRGGSRGGRQGAGKRFRPGGRRNQDGNQQQPSW